MKSKSQIVLDELESSPDQIQAEIIAGEFQKKLEATGLSSLVSVSSVEFGEDSDILVNFEDADGELYSLSFMYDEEEGPQAFPILDDSDKGLDDEDDDAEPNEVAFDLGAFNPSIITHEKTQVVNLTDLSWLEPEILLLMLQGCGLEVLPADVPSYSTDAFGNFIKNESMNELFITRISHGKRVRVQAVRRLRKRRLTSKQRAGIRRAVMTRRREKTQIARSRTKSLAVRKRMHIKPVHLPKGFRVRR